MSDAATETIDFGAMLDQHLNRIKSNFNIGDKVSGRITAIDSHTIFVDVQAQNEAMLDRIELVDDSGTCKVKVGDTLEARVISTDDGEIRLSSKITGTAVADASLWDAYQAKLPIEGRVTGEIKGGYEVTVGSIKGFCPYSQIDIYKHDAALYIGQKFLFQVREYTEDGRRLVVNRRALLEQEQQRMRQDMQERLKVGDVLTGKVSRIQPFGVFVNLGGVDGLIPVSELAWKRGIKPEDIVKEGQDVTVMIRDLDWEKNRISLSLKMAQGDPWTQLAEKFIVGTRHSGTVTQIMQFGAFVELEPGIEGMIHISKLGAGRRLRTPDEVVKIGDTVEVTIDSVDTERRRMSLAMIPLPKPVVEEAPAPAPVVAAPAAPATDGTAATAAAPAAAPIELVVGLEVVGTVDALKDFGAFIKLPNGKSGLLHISQMGLADSPARLRTMYNQYAVGKSASVIVKEINGDRVSLTLRSMLEQDAESAEFESFQKARAAAGGSLNPLGSLVDFSKLTLS